MISLVMGLIVALAAIALAKTSTTAFHEQARMNGVEMVLRSASERFRADLLKVSYMSTPNVRADNKIARLPTPSLPVAYRDLTLDNLSGLRVDVGAGKSRTQGALSLATAHNLNPDDVYISGNLTSDDMYRAQWVDVSTCGGPRLRISGKADPAVSRLYNGATVPADMVTAAQAVFMPGLNMTPPVPNIRYAVQITDMRGCTNYLQICAISAAPDPEAVYLDIASDTNSRGILTPEDTKGTCGGRLMEEFSVAPIMRVRWYLDSSTDARITDTTLDGDRKFNLYRQLLAGNGTTVVGPPELIAEYAVDLKIGLVVDDNISAPPTHKITYFDTEGAEANITAWTADPTTITTATQPQPQHIRSARYRMAFRAPYYDRTAPLTVGTGTPYLARYCVGSSSLANCKQWTRVRTVISEVALLNQQRVFY